MNTLGHLFKVSSFGESHGSHVGCIIDGCPAGLQVDVSLMQEAVDKRKTAQHSFASARKESDRVQILSGIFEGKTLGSPVCILIQNEDARPADYDDLKNTFRPGHADAAYQQKYGFRDHRGGGRSSIRITAAMVAAGELARQLLTYYFPVKMLTYVKQIGPVTMPDPYPDLITEEAIENSAVKCPDQKTSDAMLTLIEQTKQEGDTLGGAISATIKNIPAGLGEPVYGKLQAQLAHAMMNINSAKAFEYGEGIRSALLKGSEHNDAFIEKDQRIATASNHHGGILGGISSGEDICFTVWLKPISSILHSQKSVDMNLQQTDIEIKGRHDVCAVPRAVPIVEAYTYITLADMLLQNKLSKI
jgi:chorismate synthase